MGISQSFCEASVEFLGKCYSKIARVRNLPYNLPILPLDQLYFENTKTEADKCFPV